ncbi:MAG: hypothetical protein LN568_02250 [Rickettsia endosymbiont of Pseudomimeciton antennatum]|nr:hypothetical protein [Rickettsia endosymbiont of Pseudomimeciton antennatum]
MIDLQLLNILLFSDNANNLKNAINTLNSSANRKKVNNVNVERENLTPKQFTDILSYCMQYNNNLTEEKINDIISNDNSSKKIITSFTHDSGVLPKIEDAEIYAKFYKEEEKHNFFGFKSAEEFDHTKANTNNFKVNEKNVTTTINSIRAKKKEILNLKINDNEFQEFKA